MHTQTQLSLVRSAFDAVLFDLDGTLVDTLGDVTEALNCALNRAGVRQFSSAEVRSLFGGGILNLMQRALRTADDDPERAASLVPEYLEIYETIALKTNPAFDGVPTMLQDLAAAGFSIAVITNKSRRAAQTVLQVSGLEHIVDVLIDAETSACLKPDPSHLRESLMQLGVKPQRAVMVGDMSHDVIAAHAAGTHSIFAAYGYGQGPWGGPDPDETIREIGDLPRALVAISKTKQIDLRLDSPIVCGAPPTSSLLTKAAARMPDLPNVVGELAPV